MTRLKRSGLVVKLDSRYELRRGSLLATIEEAGRDVSATSSRIKMVANEIDENGFASAILKSRL